MPTTTASAQALTATTTACCMPTPMATAWVLVHRPRAALRAATTARRRMRRSIRALRNFARLSRSTTTATGRLPRVKRPIERRITSMAMPTASVSRRAVHSRVHCRPGIRRRAATATMQARRSVRARSKYATTSTTTAMRRWMKASSSSRTTPTRTLTDTDRRSPRASAHALRSLEA